MKNEFKTASYVIRIDGTNGDEFKTITNGRIYKDVFGTNADDKQKEITHIPTGLLVSGRGHYFSTLKEIKEVLDEFLTVPNIDWNISDKVEFMKQINEEETKNKLFLILGLSKEKY